MSYRAALFTLTAPALVLAALAPSTALAQPAQSIEPAQPTQSSPGAASADPAAATSAATPSPESAPPAAAAPGQSPAAPANSSALGGNAALNVAVDTPAPDKVDSEPKGPPPNPMPHHFGAQLGLRQTFIPHSGFDPYANNNALVQGTITATFTPWITRPVSAHLVGEWAIGSTTSLARNDPTSLTVHRLALGLEGRYAPVSRLYLFAKVMPSALHLRATIEDYGLSTKLASRSWTWGLDTTGGAALRLGSAGKESRPAASFWLTLDMGYSFAGEAEMTFHPIDVEDESRRYGDIALPALRPAGFITRFAGAITF